MFIFFIETIIPFKLFIISKSIISLILSFVMKKSNGRDTFDNYFRSGGISVIHGIK